MALSSLIARRAPLSSEEMVRGHHWAAKTHHAKRTAPHPGSASRLPSNANPRFSRFTQPTRPHWRQSQTRCRSYLQSRALKELAQTASPVSPTEVTEGGLPDRFTETTGREVGYLTASSGTVEMQLLKQLIPFPTDTPHRQKDPHPFC